MRNSGDLEYADDDDPARSLVICSLSSSGCLILARLERRNEGVTTPLPPFCLGLYLALDVMATECLRMLSTGDVIAGCWWWDDTGSSSHIALEEDDDDSLFPVVGDIDISVSLLFSLNRVICDIDGRESRLQGSKLPPLLVTVVLCSGDGGDCCCDGGGSVFAGKRDNESFSGERYWYWYWKEGERWRCGGDEGELLVLAVVVVAVLTILANELLLESDATTAR